MKKYSFKFFLIIIFLCLFNSAGIAVEKTYKIIKLVNEHVITNYDLEQRLKLYATLNNVNINSENIDKYAIEILSLMVSEKLQLDKINSYNITVKESEIDDYINRAYLDSDKNMKDLINLLENSELDISILRESIRIIIGWNNLAGKLFYRISEIDQNDLESTMKQDPSLTKDQATNILLQEQIGLRAKKLLRDIRNEATIENR